MKFESKFGPDEIVVKDIYQGEKLIASHLLKVVHIVVDANGTVAYLCENPDNLSRHYYLESDLEGDPDYDQEAGCYPDNEDK